MSKALLIKKALFDGKSLIVGASQPLKDLLKWRGTVARPCLKIALNTSLIMACGDVIAQCLVEKRSMYYFNYLKEEELGKPQKKTFDWSRFSRFFTVGLFIAGPSMFYWYRYLDRYIIIGSFRSRALKKLAFDQLFFLPVYLMGYMASLGLLRGDSGKEIKQHITKNFAPCLLDSYKLWPAVQLVNFTMVPGHCRVQIINLFALLWNIYLGWKTENSRV